MTISENPSSEARLLLPVPTTEETERFAALYRRKYGLDLAPEQAHQILSGLMRFLYLTRRVPVDTHAEASDEDGASHD